jgi:hypothetical protein
MGAIAGGKSIDRPSGTPACEFAMDRSGNTSRTRKRKINGWIS